MESNNLYFSDAKALTMMKSLCQVEDDYELNEVQTKHMRSRTMSKPSIFDEYKYGSVKKKKGTGFYDREKQIDIINNCNLLKSTFSKTKRIPQLRAKYLNTTLDGSKGKKDLILNSTIQSRSKGNSSQATSKMGYVKPGTGNETQGSKSYVISNDEPYMQMNIMQIQNQLNQTLNSNIHFQKSSGPHQF